VSDLGVENGPAQAGLLSPADLNATTTQRVEDLLDEGHIRGARKLVAEALDAGGSRKILLWSLADVEFADHDLGAGRSRLAEAVEANGRDPEAVSRQIRDLYRNGLWREALLAVESIPADVLIDPLVRAQAGGFYRGCGCYAHATECYGPHSGLPRAARTARRWCRLRSGGPFTRIRRTARAWEESKLLAGLRRRILYADQLGEIAGLETRDALRLQAQLEKLNYRLNSRTARSMAVGRMLYRVMPANVLLVWLVLFVIVNQVRFESGPGGTGAGTAISAAVTIAIVILTMFALVRPNLEYRFNLPLSTRTFLAFFFLIAVYEAAVAEGYDRHVLPTTGWWSWVVLGLAAAPAAIACGPASHVVFLLRWRWWLRGLIREDCLLVMLDALLPILDDLRGPPRCRRLAQRIRDARILEFAARRLTQDLLPARFVSYARSGGWLTRRAAGWAEALRHLQRHVVAPVPGSHEKLRKTLEHEILCLANGDLGALAWRQPPPGPSRRIMLRRHAITIIRTILVAALPLAAVLAAQPFVHTSQGTFGWARIATGTWALLYVVLSLDPAIRDKIDTASELVGLLHNARSISKLDSR
jgi:hypothetical protein